MNTFNEYSLFECHNLIVKSLTESRSCLEVTWFQSDSIDI